MRLHKNKALWAGSLLTFAIATSQYNTLVPEMLVTFFLFYPDQETVGQIGSGKIRSGMGTVRTFSIRYQYFVDGAYFDNDLVRFSPSNFDVGETLALYKPGEEVQVFYNPKSPSFSVLERESLHPWVWAHVMAWIVMGWLGYLIGDKD